MNVNLMSKRAPKKNQKGFTLIELIVVVVILGILFFLTVSALGGGTNSANAAAVRSMSNELGRAVGFLNVNLGTGIDTSTSNPISASGDDMMDVIVKGRASVAAAYQARFDQLNMRPLQGKIVVNGANFTMMNYDVGFTMTSCPSNRVCVEFGRVPNEVFREVASKEGVAYSDTANTAGETLRWTAPTGGLRTITMLIYP
ncbi:hypothetical protein LCGC14_0328030 [marine sediment metagenome]|uniref:Prepilin-type N-terminal cleavage/methylation domain-containing protein n=1 Tax=marine sediment metagenome TaxID=412755 RepID=A0A0F9TMU7_9ZZZZ